MREERIGLYGFCGQHAVELRSDILKDSQDRLDRHRSPRRVGDSAAAERRWETLHPWEPFVVGLAASAS